MEENERRRAEGGIVRSEEELVTGAQSEVSGSVGVRKRVETERVAERVPRRVEHADVERVAAGEEDSGEVETLPDGSLSIPVLEEELVVTKRTVVRERILVRKRAVTEERTVEAELRKERVELDAAGDVEIEETD